MDRKHYCEKYFGRDTIPTNIFLKNYFRLKLNFNVKRVGQSERYTETVLGGTLFPLFFFWKDYFGIKLSFNVKREGQPGLPQRYTETAYGFVPSTTAISHSITISCPQLHSITIPIYNYVGSTLMSHDHYKWLGYPH